MRSTTKGKTMYEYSPKTLLTQKCIAARLQSTVHWMSSSTACTSLYGQSIGKCIFFLIFSLSLVSLPRQQSLVYNQWKYAYSTKYTFTLSSTHTSVSITLPVLIKKEKRSVIVRIPTREERESILRRSLVNHCNEVCSCAIKESPHQWNSKRRLTKESTTTRGLWISECSEASTAHPRSRTPSTGLRHPSFGGRSLCGITQIRWQ